MRLLFAVTCLSLVFTSYAQAHKLWINAYESFNRPPGHALVSLGFGHNIPMDDLFIGDSGGIQLESFTMADPKGRKIELPMPGSTRMEPMSLKDGITVEKGDLGIRKLQFGEQAAEGTYGITATSKAMYFTKYLDKDGKERVAATPMSEAKDLEKTLTALKIKIFAKSFLAYNKWTEPEPEGFDLEIIPLADVSNLHAGDVVPIKVLFMGKPLGTKGIDFEYILATSNTFGGPGKNGLVSVLLDGRADFKLPTAGQWLLNVYCKRDVAADPSLGALEGKVKTVLFGSSLSLMVKP